MVFSNIGDTALVVLIPEAEPVVGSLREEFDPSAAEHMPAHLTVLYPFMPAREIDAAAVGSMRRFFASQRSEALLFGSVSAWPGRTVWLDPASQAATDLLANTRNQWPRYLPYGRADIEPIPHLTIGDGVSEEVEHQMRAAIEPMLPIHSSLDAVDLMAFDGERWVSRHQFDLDASS